ncbi:MAG: ABC transporter substrate-binding protein [Dehalococcoidia bacterium]|nr:ABC transporter substrate-binding protein [Dehalococcoidia bacterium]
MKTRISIALAVLTVMALVATACGPSPTATPVPTATAAVTPTPAAETLIIGNASILSGPGTGFGIPQSRGVEKGTELVNAAGGIKVGSKRYMIKLNTYDWGYTADGGRAGAEKLLNDGVKIIIGCGTGTSVGAQQVTEPNKALLFYGGTADSLVDKAHPYTFRILMGTRDGYMPTVTYARDQNPGNRKYFGTSYNDATGKIVYGQTEQAVKALSWETFESKLYEPGTTDFAPFVTGYLMPSGANFLLMVSRTGEAGLLMKAARQYGYKGIIVWPSAAGGLPEFQIAGQAADGAILTQDWDWSGPYIGDEMKKLAVEYNTQYGSYPTMLFLNAVDAVRMIKAAVELSGSTDATAMRDAMPRIEWDSVFGGKGKLASVGDRPGATVVHLMPVAKYDYAANKLVNVAQAIPPDKWTK